MGVQKTYQTLVAPVLRTLTGAFKAPKETAAAVAPGAGIGMLRWEAGTNANTLKLVAYAGTSTTGVTVIDNVGAGN